MCRCSGGLDNSGDNVDEVGRCGVAAGGQGAQARAKASGRGRRQAEEARCQKAPGVVGAVREGFPPIGVEPAPGGRSSWGCQRWSSVVAVVVVFVALVLVRVLVLVLVLLFLKV